MGYKLVREVLDYAPADLTWAELAVWLVLADDANDHTRTGWLAPDQLYRRTRHGKSTVAEVLAKLARRGYELRVVRGYDKNGRPVYAYRGKQTTYRMPVLRPVDDPVDNSVDDPVDNSEKGSGTSGPIKRERVRDSRERVRDSRPKGPDSPEPFPSASPHITSAAADDPNVRIVMRATGCTAELAAAAIELIRCEKNPGNLGGFLTHLARAHELGPWVNRAVAGERPMRGADRLVAQTLALADRLQAEADARAHVINGELVEPCPHGEERGAQYCALCRYAVRRPA